MLQRFCKYLEDYNKNPEFAAIRDEIEQILAGENLEVSQSRVNQLTDKVKPLAREKAEKAREILVDQVSKDPLKQAVTAAEDKLAESEAKVIKDNRTPQSLQAYEAAKQEFQDLLAELQEPNALLDLESDASKNANQQMVDEARLAVQVGLQTYLEAVAALVDRVDTTQLKEAADKLQESRCD